jgi:uncharacterized protein YbjT (DUF2867 family)
MTTTASSPIAVSAPPAPRAPPSSKPFSPPATRSAPSPAPRQARALTERGIDTRAVDLADRSALTDALTGVSGVFAHLPFVPVPELIEAWSTSLVSALAAAEVPMTVFTLSGPSPERPHGDRRGRHQGAGPAILERAQTPLVYAFLSSARR